MNSLEPMLRKFLIQQNIFQNPFFYVYNIGIPLLLPAFIIIIVGPDKFIGINELGMVITQIFLYNIMMLSTNLGVLHMKSSEDDKDIFDTFKEQNNMYSILFLVLSALLLMRSYNCFPIAISSDPVCFDYPKVLLTFAAIFSAYFTMWLLSRNPNFTFADPNIGGLAKKRQEQAIALGKKFLGENG